jgi:glycosyltransferase involved in cell wall biosynthesis
MSPNAQATAALIIPALNEAEVIGTTLASIPPGVFSTIVVADNGSTDRTSEIAQSLGAAVVYEPERGYGAACLKALATLPESATAVVFMQADGSEDPAQAVQLLAPIYDGRADLVIGSRTLGCAEPGALLPHQALGNTVAAFLIRILYRHTYTDLGPFRAVRMQSLRRLKMQDRNFGWTVEMQVKALREGLRIMEIPVNYRRRLAGENKVSGNLWNSLRAGIKIIWTVLRWAAGRSKSSTASVQPKASAQR